MSKNAIIILADNNENTIIKCINSVLYNAVKPYMIIVIDNYSSDNTYQKITEKFQIKNIEDNISINFDSINLKIFRKPKTNRSISLNIGLQIIDSSVDNIGILNGNSFYEYNKIEECSKILDRYTFVGGIVNDFCCKRSCDSHSIVKNLQPFDINKFIFKYDYDSNFFFKYRMLKLIGLFDIKAKFEDYEFLRRLSTRGLLYHIPKILHHNIINE